MEKDSLLLGRIKEIHKYELKISLPHNMIGTCPISNISAKYCELLQEIVKGGSNNDNVAELREMFVVMQYVQVRVKEINKAKVQVTMVPQELYKDINMTKLRTGMPLQFAIKSEEDKGYILETGIKGVNAFLPFNSSGKMYKIGQLVTVTLEKNIEGSKQALNMFKVIRFIEVDSKKEVNDVFKELTDFSCIFPGVVIQSKLKLQDYGNLSGKISDFSVVVRIDHHRYEDKPKEFEQTLRVIGKNLVTKTLDCSCLPHLIPPFIGIQSLANVVIGYSLKDCEVTKRLKSKQYILESAQFVNVQLLVGNNFVEPTAKLVVGDSVTSRIIDYNLLDNIIIATTLKEHLSQPYFGIHQARIGDVITATVKKYQRSGYKVKISSYLNGFVPNSHLTDAPFNTTSVGIMLRPDDKIKCRVFGIDYVENKIILTMKKSLLSSDLKFVESFSDLKKGMQLDGVVLKRTEIGLLVMLPGQLKGFVHVSKIQQDKRSSLEEFYFVGQSLKVTVLSFDESKNRIELSLLGKQLEQEVDKQLVGVQIGQVFKCVIGKPNNEGFDVRLLPLKIRAFLPFTQLSDSREHQLMFRSHYSTTQGKQATVVVVDKSSELLTVSRKHLLVRAATDGRLLTSTQKLVEGTQWLGWIDKKLSQGLAVHLPGGGRGFVPMTAISSVRVAGKNKRSADLFQVGDTVEVRVVQCNPNKPCLMSMRMIDIYRAVTHTERALDALQDVLADRRLLQAACNGPVVKLEIGQLITAKVTGHCKWGYTVTVGDKVVPGFVLNQHLPEGRQLTEGSLQEAVIINIDLAEQTVQLCMSVNVVNAVRNGGRCVDAVQINQQMKAEVLAVTSEFVVCLLLGHGNGCIIFVPVRRCINDMGRDMAWHVRQRNVVVIKRWLKEEKVFVGWLYVNEAVSGSSNEPQELTAAAVVKRWKDLPKKVKMEDGQVYPAFFDRLGSHTVTVYVSRQQRVMCDIIEYSTALDDVAKLLQHPPQLQEAIGRSVTIADASVKLRCIPRGHFLPYTSLSDGTVVCGQVTNAPSSNIYRLRLPFGCIGEANMNENGYCGLVMALRIRALVQCRIVDASCQPCKVSIMAATAESLGKQRQPQGEVVKVIFCDKTEEQQTSLSKPQPRKRHHSSSSLQLQDAVVNKNDEYLEFADQYDDDKVLPSLVVTCKAEASGENNLAQFAKRARRESKGSVEEQARKRHHSSTSIQLQDETNYDDDKYLEFADPYDADEVLPLMVVTSKAKAAGENSLAQLAKRVRTESRKLVDELRQGSNVDTDQNDISNQEDNDEVDSKKQKRVDKMTEEMRIRAAERRREEGEMYSNPQTTEEFEMVVFNRPHNASSWTRYIDYLLTDGNGSIDKARGICERAMRTLKPEDIDNRYIVMRRFAEIEIDALHGMDADSDGTVYEEQVDRVKAVIARGLVQRRNGFYRFVCQKLRAVGLFDLATETAKEFVKDEYHSHISWMELFLARFEQRQFNAIKDMMINAERTLKSGQFRLLQVEVARTEISHGNEGIGLEMLMSLVEKRPKDTKLRQACISVVQSLNRTDLVERLSTVSA